MLHELAIADHSVGHLRLHRTRAIHRFQVFRLLSTNAVAVTATIAMIVSGCLWLCRPKVMHIMILLLLLMLLMLLNLLLVMR